MTKHTLQVKLREIVGRKVKTLRATGVVPANVFGHNIKSQAVQLSEKDFQKIYAQVGESSLVYLQIEGEPSPRPVLVHATAVHPVSGQLLHVDFHQVNLKEKVTAPVKLLLVGESPIVKSGQGILVQQIDELEVEALPTDMPEHVQVDISTLDQIDMAITVAEVKVDTKLVIKTEPETIVVKIEPLAKEEPKEAVAEAALPTEQTPGAEAATDQNSGQPAEAAATK